MGATSVGCLQRLTGCSSLIILLRFIPSIQRKSWAFYEYVMEQVDVSVVVVCICSFSYIAISYVRSNRLPPRHRLTVILHHCSMHVCVCVCAHITTGPINQCFPCYCGLYFCRPGRKLTQCGLCARVNGWLWRKVWRKKAEIDSKEKWGRNLHQAPDWLGGWEHLTTGAGRLTGWWPLSPSLLDVFRI